MGSLNFNLSENGLTYSTVEDSFFTQVCSASGFAPLTHISGVQAIERRLFSFSVALIGIVVALSGLIVILLGQNLRFDSLETAAIIIGAVVVLLYYNVKTTELAIYVDGEVFVRARFPRSESLRLAQDIESELKKLRSEIKANPLPSLT